MPPKCACPGHECVGEPAHDHLERLRQPVDRQVVARDLVEAAEVVQAADRVLVLVAQEHGVEAIEVGCQGLGPEVGAAVDHDPPGAPGKEDGGAEAPVAGVARGAGRAVAGDPGQALAGPGAEDPDAQLAGVGAGIARVEARLQPEPHLVPGHRPPRPRPGAARRRVAGVRLARPRAATAASDRIPSPGRRTTTAGPPAATRSSASLARASAAWFSLRGTWRALQRRSRPRCAIACAWSGASLASFTRQRPRSCSTMSIESRSRATSSAPSSSARARARRSPVYSATLFVWRPSASETVAIGGASGRSAPGASASMRTAPHEAGPGLPRAAPSVRMMRRRGPAPLRPSAPRSPATPRGSPA